LLFVHVINLGLLFNFCFLDQIFHLLELIKSWLVFLLQLIVHFKLSSKLISDLIW